MPVSNIYCGYDAQTQHLRVTWSWRHEDYDIVRLTLTRKMDKSVILERVVDWTTFAAAAAQGNGVDLGKVDCPVSLTIREGEEVTAVNVEQAPRYVVHWGLIRHKRMFVEPKSATLRVVFPPQLTEKLLPALAPWAIGYGTPDGDIGFLPGMEPGENIFGPFELDSKADIELNVAPKYRDLIVLERYE